MDLQHVQWRWLLLLAVSVLGTSILVSVLTEAALLSVFPAFAGMALVGLAMGWALRHIVRFNPYEY